VRGGSAEWGLRDQSTDMRIAPNRFVALLVTTVGSILRAPREWRAARWSAAAATTASLALAYAEKRPLQELLHGGGRLGFADWLARAASAAGEGVIVTAVGVAMLGAGAVLGLRRVADAAWVLGAAGLPCWLLVVVGQFVFAESRPIDGGAMHWFASGGHGVSGHASAGALLLGPVRVLAAGAHRVVRASAVILIIGWGLLVAWSRVWLDMHYVWNVGVGLLLGWATTSAAFAAWRHEGTVPGRGGLGRGVGT